MASSASARAAHPDSLLASNTGHPEVFEQVDEPSRQDSTKYVSTRGSIFFTICSFVMQFIGGGVAFMWGRFLEALCHDASGTSAQMAAAIGASSDTVSFLFYFLGGQMVATCGMRIISYQACLLILAGLFSSSQAPTVPCLFITHGIFVGAGRGLGNVAAQTGGFGLVRPHHLKVAQGVAQTGLGLGWLTFTGIAHVAIERNGWQAAYLWLGTLSLLLQVMKVDNVPLVLLGFAIYSAAFDVPIKHLANYADGVLGHSVGSLCTGLMGVGSGIGRVTMICFMDAVGSINLLLLCVIVGGSSLIMLSFCTTPSALVVFAVVYGYASGGKMTVGTFAVASIFGEDLVQRIWGCVGLVYILGPWIGSPVAGSFYDATGSYGHVFVLSGALVLSSLAPFALLRHRHHAKRRQQETEADQQS